MSVECANIMVYVRSTQLGGCQASMMDLEPCVPIASQRRSYVAPKDFVTVAPKDFVTGAPIAIQMIIR